MSIEESFCYKYLSNFSGIKSETIDLLVRNDYDSIESLLALDLTLDLDALPNLSMGQKSVLRKALIGLSEEYNKLDINSDNNVLDTSTQRINGSKSVIKELIETEVCGRSKCSDSGHSFGKQVDKSLDNINVLMGSNDKIITNKDINVDNSLCDICGDIGTQVFSGGKSCIACRQFFAKNYFRYFDCAFDGNCLISQKTRNGCRHCRLKKCGKVMKAQEIMTGITDGSVCQVDLNDDSTSMRIETQPNSHLTPITTESQSKQEKETKTQECAVCGDLATEYNKGARTCRGCYIFFLRVASNERAVNDCIYNTRECVINTSNRAKCRYCRYSKCLDVGMVYTKSKRPPMLDSPKYSEVMDTTYAVVEENCILPKISDVRPITDFEFASITCGRSFEELDQKKTKKKKR